ncbi:hypothetical protein [Methanococcoides burtonii]|nr:hypothetical protein [Methanococcoides burtonii]
MMPLDDIGLLAGCSRKSGYFAVALHNEITLLGPIAVYSDIRQLSD